MVASEILFVALQLFALGLAAPVDSQAAVVETDTGAQPTDNQLTMDQLENMTESELASMLGDESSENQVTETDTSADVSLDRRGCEPPCAKACCFKPCCIKPCCIKPCCLKPPCPCDIAGCLCCCKPCGH